MMIYTIERRWKWPGCVNTYPCGGMCWCTPLIMMYGVGRHVLWHFMCTMSPTDVSFIDSLLSLLFPRSFLPLSLFRWPSFRWPLFRCPPCRCGVPQAQLDVERARRREMGAELEKLQTDRMSCVQSLVGLRDMMSEAANGDEEASVE